MKTMGFAFALGAIGVVSCFAVACGGEDFGSCEANNTCGSTGGKDGGTGATGGTSSTGGTSGTGGSGGTGGSVGGTGGDGGTCDTSKSPSEEACLVDDNNAVFVSPTGSATGAGTKTDPLNTFADAITKAKTAGHARVIACNGDYDEKLTLTAAADGVKVYGGFKCTDWSYDATAKANLKPTTRGIVLTLDTLAAGATFEDVGFTAMPGSDPGESSIAAFAKESGTISMKRVKLEAGKGVTGATGTKTDYTYPTQSTLNGKDASGDNGGAFNQVTCPDGTKTTGAKGGDGGTGVTGGGLGQPDLGAGKGGVIGDCSTGGGTGGTGNPGTAITPASGAKTLGSLATSGWSGTPGADGTPGGPGQGGGGGAGATTANGGGGGGGGGAGACGGAPGKGGSAGGSSIALLALNTTVTLDSSELISTDGGDGGAGIAGQQGQQIGGAAGNKSGFGCSGGNGGKGADGGAGGGGAGGVSAGVVWKGKTPTLTATTPKLGNKGAKGVGGKAGTNDGIDGDAKPTLEVQ